MFFQLIAIFSLASATASPQNPPPEGACFSYGRGVGTIPKSCPEGKTEQAGLCYNPCPTGWKAVGPVCWGGWKGRGRGAGTIPNNCGDKENQAGLCYNKCRDGFHGVGPVCWQNSC